MRQKGPGGNLALGMGVGGSAQQTGCREATVVGERAAQAAQWLVIEKVLICVFKL
jgi:hypothetical protein